MSSESLPSAVLWDQNNGTEGVASDDFAATGLPADMSPFRDSKEDQVVPSSSPRPPPSYPSLTDGASASRGNGNIVLNLEALERGGPAPPIGQIVQNTNNVQAGGVREEFLNRILDTVSTFISNGIRTSDNYSNEEGDISELRIDLSLPATQRLSVNEE